jgi:ATP adenylyltransferase
LDFVTGGRKETCIFCSKPMGGDDRKNHIFARRKYVFGMLNAFPYNSGHIMIAPYRHLTNIQDIGEEEWSEALRLLKDTITAIGNLMEPQGYNIGLNLGSAAGGGFDHLHVHLVPRWRGDTNFMPVLTDTKVLPEHLDSTYDRIVEAMKRKNV